MNAFTDKTPLVDTSVYKKSESARKGGMTRAKAENGSAVKSMSNNQPEKREINRAAASRQAQ